ncbi:MAG: hypothetical protein ACRCWM_12440 [Sarcina sp.]
MNFKNRKKKGSSLLIVIAMMAIVSIIVISVLVMTSSGYKMRRESNNRVESFYGADSGLEISERVLINYINAAVDYSNKIVESTIPTATMEEKNKVFKKNFVTFFEIGGNSEVLPFHDTRAVVNTHDYKEICTEIAIDKYYKSVGRDDVKIQNQTLKYKDKNGNETTNKEQTVKMDVHVESEYTEKEKIREVGVNFEVTVPDYGKTIVKTKGAKAPNIFDYIIGVDGDLEFEIGNTTQVYGDFWVRGNTEKSNTMTADNKYNGGISIYPSPGTQGAEFALNGGLVTGGTLSTKDINFKIEATSNKSIYANNIKMESENLATENIINTGEKDIFVYNDIVLNGKKNKLTTQNLYGLNDINKYENGFQLTEADRSSALLINDVDFKTEDTKITVKNDAYLLGTAYVDLNKGGAYQTGQSNSINSFTKPYTQREGMEGKYVYDYKGNLHLIDEHQDGSEVDLGEKRNLARDYALAPEEEAMAKILNVTGNMYNTGATFATVTTKPGKKIHDYNPPTDRDRKKYQEEYAKEVFNMGAEGSDVSQFWNKDYAESVEGSFKWENFDDVIDQAQANDKVNVKSANKTQMFLDMESVKNSTDIYKQAILDPLKPNLRAYEPVVAVNQKPHIILSGSDKSLIIRESKGGGDNLQVTDTELIYTMDISKYGSGDTDKPPVLVIAKGDVQIKPVNGWNHTMTLTAGTASYYVSNKGVGGIIGNYANGSVELTDEKGNVIYKAGQHNYLNELFKYMLESNDLMGEIGEGIFGNSESKEIIEAIEISDILTREDWKLIK